MIGKGRNVLLTSYKEITNDNVIGIVRDAMQLYKENVKDCEFLLDYASGIQPLSASKIKK